MFSFFEGGVSFVTIPPFCSHERRCCMITKGMIWKFDKVGGDFPKKNYKEMSVEELDEFIVRQVLNAYDKGRKQGEEL